MPFKKLLALVAASLAAASAGAAEVQPEYVELTFAELSEIRITSVSKKPERLADAAASVYVITADDLRRSGAANLPEALRLAPNLQVAQTNAYGYSISARGFNSSSANKLLVLIDGRSVYTPLFAGVFWDVQDVLLEDVERIEIISGPGGTLWGTNAVNGVINIITRSAAETQGVLASAAGGNRRQDGAVRYGATLDNGVAYRLYAKYSNLNHNETASGLAVDDAAYRTQVGFRADWAGAADRLSLQANAYGGASGQPPPGVISVSGTNVALGLISVSGANVVARWERALAGGGSVSLQSYFDRTRREVVPSFSEALDIIDTQFQHTLAPLGRHALVWGASYRHSKDELINSSFFAFLPASLEQKWSSVFAQDEIRLLDALHLTLGARVEHNDYTGTEVLPNLRLAWRPAPEHTLWSAVSRAVRAPSRFDIDVYVPSKPPFLLDGGAQVRSELATVYEVGYRGQAAAALSYSLTVFHTDYDYLRTQDIAPNGRQFIFTSNMEGSTTGVEMWGTWQANAAWRLHAGLTALRERLHLKPGSNDTTSVAGAGRDPAHQWMLRSSHDLPGQGQLDLSLRRVAALSAPVVPAYYALDMRYAWKPTPNWELSVAGRNLNGSHGEFNPLATRSEIPRSIYVEVAARF